MNLVDNCLQDSLKVKDNKIIKTICSINLQNYILTQSVILYLKKELKLDYANV